MLFLIRKENIKKNDELSQFRSEMVKCEYGLSADRRPHVSKDRGLIAVLGTDELAAICSKSDSADRIWVQDSGRWYL